MKKIVSILMTVIMLFSFTASFTAAEVSFEDVTESDWFCNAVSKVKELGYMNGTSDTEFSPYGAVSRAMAVQVLYNISGEEIQYSPCFDDVGENDWFASAVCWAKEAGIANGTSDTRFTPNALMTREQLACFINRYIKSFEVEGPGQKGDAYTDIDNCSEWSKESVLTMAQYKIMSPRVESFFYPEATVSRAEFAAFVLSMMGYEEAGRDSSVHVQLIYSKVAAVTLEKGQKLSVEGALYPENSADTVIIYSSSDPSVASVDKEGNVTANKAGTARITLTCRDGGFKAYSDIKVTQPSDNKGNADNNDAYNSSADNSGMISIGGRRIDPNKPMVALTYDDGPHRTYTNRILDTLEKYNSAATFFELGERAVNCADVIKREVELGCEVANHSYSHPNLATLSAGGVSSQISRTNDVIYNACGIRPKLVRPPYGSNNSTVRNNAGAPIILWSIDTLDWKYRNASYVTSVIKSNVTDGSVILMHSLYDSTATATEIIVPWLLSQGYQLVTVSELAEARGIKMQNGKVYTAFYD